jgi:hypothetical protein
MAAHNDESPVAVRLVHEEHEKGGGVLVRGTLSTAEQFGKLVPILRSRQRLIDVQLPESEPPRQMSVYVRPVEGIGGAFINAPGIPLVAVLEWGSGSGFQREPFPLRLRGSVRTVNAKHVILTVGQTGAPVAQGASASLGFGTVQSGVLRTDHADLPAGGGPTPFQVPEWASQVRILFDFGPAVFGQGAYRWLDAAGGALVATAAQTWISLPAPIPRVSATLEVLHDPVNAGTVVIEWAGPIA